VSQRTDAMAALKARVEAAIAELRAAVDAPRMGEPYWVLGRVQGACEDLVRDAQAICVADFRRYGPDQPGDAAPDAR